MARRCSELWARNLLARETAVWRAIAMLAATDAVFPRTTAIVVEAEGVATWDDVVEEVMLEDGTAVCHGWQVKDASTRLDAATVVRLFEDLRAGTVAVGHLAVSQDVEVDRAASTRHLATLCRRCRSTASTVPDLNPNAGEEKWIRFIRGELGLEDDAGVLNVLGRCRVEHVGDEESLRATCERDVERTFSVESPRALVDALLSFVVRCDGVTRFSAEYLRRQVLSEYPELAQFAGARTRYLEALLRWIEQRTPLRGLGPADARLDDVRVPVRLSPAGGEPDTIALDDILDVSEKNDVVTVVGPVGSGKTELLTNAVRSMAVAALAHTGTPIPVFVNAATLSADDVCSAACRTLPELQSEIRWLFNRRGLHLQLFVDALDEAGPLAVEAVERARAALGNRIRALVIASRPPAPMVRGAVELRVQPWSEAEREQFLMRWAVIDSIAVQAIRGSADFNDLNELLENPLTATLCATVARRPAFAFDTRSSLYAQVTEFLYQRWARQKGSVAPRFADVAPVLRELALHVVRGNGATVSEDRLSQALRRSCPDACVDAQDAIELHLGVLVRQATGGYEFGVRGIAEYFAGQHLLQDGEPTIVEAAWYAWGLEPVRHAVGYAELSNPGQAASIIEGLLADEEHDRVGLEVGHLRRVIAAVYCAADLGTRVDRVSSRLVVACARRIDDEQSAWVGDYVCQAGVLLLQRKCRCADELLSWAIDRCTSPGHPAGYYAELAGGSPEFWMDKAFCNDPEVRSVAIAKLADARDREDVRELLVTMLLDDNPRGHVFGTPAAILAGEALRRATRDSAFQSLAETIRMLVRAEGQLISMAAAIALLPSEDDPKHLARALRHGAAAYRVPPAVLEDLAATGEGEAALDAEWPGWSEQAGSRVEIPPTWMRDQVNYQEARTAPPSRVVRDRLGMLVLSRLPALDVSLRRAVARAAPRMAAESTSRFAKVDPTLADSLLTVPPDDHLSLLGIDGQRSLGAAALRHREIRDRLLSVWRSVKGGRYEPCYPGYALEPLVEAGDDQAAVAYADWMSHSCYLIGGYRGPAAPWAVLDHPAVAHVALISARRAFAAARDGRLVPTSAASIARCTWPTWRCDPIWEEYEEWLCSGSEAERSAAMIALSASGVSPRATEDYGRRFAEFVMRGDAVDHYRLGEHLRFIEHAGLGRTLAPLVRNALRFGGNEAVQAAAILVPIAKAREPRKLSEQAAAAFSSSFMLAIDLTPGALQRVVAEAPDAWQRRLEHLISALPFALGSMMPVLECLPIENRRLLAGQIIGRSAGFELPFKNGALDSGEVHRPADLARRIVFDLGVERG